MENRYFTESMLQTIARPQDWALVSSWCPPDLPALDDPRHACWMAEHSHTHAHREFLLTLDGGGGQQGYSDGVYTRRPGSIFFFDAFEAHDYFAPEWTPDEDQLWISLLPEHIVIWTYTIRNGAFDGHGGWRRVFTPEELGLREDALLLFKPGAKTTPPTLHRLHLSSFLGLILGAVAHAGYLDERQEETEGLQRRIVSAIRQHIEATAGNGVTLDSLAQLTGYSKFHFLRLFKQYTGLSIHAYIDQCRFQRVSEMQLAGHSQKEIAFALGFSCPAAFAHWLRRYWQKLPANITTGNR